ncbi:MAG: NUDIX hydrolase [Bacteroidales bacterium]|jgi:8-oxo-dGTP diphosphatase|nr:NUDIX hydrolase [Bacteroidales bacterium]
MEYSEHNSTVQSLFVATDCVVFGFESGELKVLLVRRDTEPFSGLWALPGGLMDSHDDADVCIRRKVWEETGLEDIYMEQLFTFTEAGRDPRGHIISIAYYALAKQSDYLAYAGIDMDDINWFSVERVPLLAFDHNRIVDTALERLRKKIRYQPIGFELLEEKFTMPELHRLYEVILQTKLDNRNFRKKILGYGLLLDLHELQRGAPNRAPKLYSFNKDRYNELEKTGFYFEL